MFGFLIRLTAFVAPISLHINKEGASFAKKSHEKKPNCFLEQKEKRSKNWSTTQLLPLLSSKVPSHAYLRQFCC
jgi:hypothetical protein